MRQAEAQHALQEILHGHFDDDVVDAFQRDPDVLAAAARRLGRAGDQDAMEQIISQIAEATLDDTLDWLVEIASCPAAWLLRQISDRVA